MSCVRRPHYVSGNKPRPVKWVQGLAPADCGETLSWEYLCYVREHPISRSIPTEILYGERDALTSLETVTGFAARINAGLTVLRGGEHWFHTEEQMEALKKWLTERRHL